MPLIEPVGLDVLPVPLVAPVLEPVVDEPVDEPVVEPAELLEPYGEDEPAALGEGPNDTSVRMNLSLLDDELADEVLLPVVLPDVPVLPIVSDLSALVRQPVNVTDLLLLSDLFQSLDDVEL